jgi:hypothetical protein
LLSNAAGDARKVNEMPMSGQYAGRTAMPIAAGNYAPVRRRASATLTIGIFRRDAACSAWRKSCGVHPYRLGLAATS